MENNEMTDEELAALIDDMAEGGVDTQPDMPLSLDNIEVISVTQKAIILEKKSSGRKNTGVSRDMWRVVLVPSLSAAAILCVMFFSPLSQQYIDRGVGRGSIDSELIDSLMQSGDYQSALNLVNAEIEETSEGLPRVAYFDRFRSEEKRYETSLARAEIYELQWKRIEILSAQGDESALFSVLKDYVGIIGYHQQEAREMLTKIEGK